MKKIIALLLLLVLLMLLALCFTGCDKKPESVPNPPTSEMVLEI